jgi:oxygen-dependent protoporphyrinogen oxidase
MGLDDDVLAALLHAELAEAMDLTDGPQEAMVTRWPRAFPQYEPGHRARVDRIDRALARDAPHVVLAGAAYRGLGIAACIQQAELAAARVVPSGDG